MKRRPRDPREPLLGRQLLGFALLQGLVVLLATAILYGAALQYGVPEGRARAMAFAVLVIGNTALILSNRSRTRSILATLATPNRPLWYVIAGALGGLLLALYVPALHEVFHFEPLAWHELLLSAIAAFGGVVLTEIGKRMLYPAERR